MSRLTILLALAACTLRPYDFDASATATDLSTTTTTAPDPTTTSATTSDPATTTTSTTTPDATSSTTDDTGASFVRPPDGVPSKECDPWIEDCPADEKCMPSSADGDPSWDSLECVPIVRDPAGIGEPCEVFGSPVSGEDTCDKHALCWYVDPDTLIGTCLAFCDGTPDQPMCAPGTTCLGCGSECVLNLCYPTCDPLAPDCPDGDICIPNPQDVSSFVCMLDASGDEGQTFDVCEYANACDPGLLCANPQLATECDHLAAGCCLPFCDLFAPNTCPGQDQQCLPWFDEGMAPAGLEHVGICGLPQ